MIFTIVQNFAKRIYMKFPHNCFLLKGSFCVYLFLDYVYVETQPSHPYQIRRIEELTKVRKGIFFVGTFAFLQLGQLSQKGICHRHHHHHYHSGAPKPVSIPLYLSLSSIKTLSLQSCIMQF